MPAAFRYRLTGTETYTLELLERCRRSVRRSTSSSISTPNCSPDDCATSAHAVFIPFPRLLDARPALDRIGAPSPGVLFVPGSRHPACSSASVVTIHDLGYLHVPESHPPEQVRMLDWTTRWNARVAKRIIATRNSPKMI